MTAAANPSYNALYPTTAHNADEDRSAQMPEMRN